MAVSSASGNRFKFAIKLFPGERQGQAFAVGDAFGIAFLGRKLLAGGIGHSFGFN
jgi:hypothetical protein